MLVSLLTLVQLFLFFSPVLIFGGGGVTVTDTFLPLCSVAHVETFECS